MKTAIILIAAVVLMAFAVLGLSRPAHAQALQCVDHAAVVAGLARHYQEAVVAMGIAANGFMIEVFASDAGTWTIVQTMPGGVSCLVASGGSFEAVSEGLPKEDVPG